MSRIKVLHQVLDPTGSGGVSAEFRALDNSLLSKDHDFESMILYHPHKWINLRDIYFYYKHIVNEKPDIIHIRGAAADGLNAIIAARVYGKAKILVVVHGMVSDSVYISKIKRWVYRNIVEYLSFTLCDGISCVCERISQRDYFKKYKEKMLPYVYNRMPSFDDSKYLIYRSEIRKEYDIKDDDVVFAYIGRLSREKGLDILFEALDIIHDDLPDNFVLLIVGGGDYYQHCVDMYSDCSYRVVFTDNQSNTERFFRAADVFISPSLHENHSIALLEACSAALPCVVTDCGGNRETISNGQTGIIVPVGDAYQLSLAIKKMLDPKNREFYRCNLKHYDFSDFSDEACDRALDNVYKMLMI